MMKKFLLGLSLSLPLFAQQSGMPPTVPGTSGHCPSITSTNSLQDSGGQCGNVTAVELQNGTYRYEVDTGAANAYVIAPSPAVSSYVAGLTLSFKVANANTTSSTLNVSGLGTKTIFKGGTTNLASGDFPAGSIQTVVYDGAAFQVQSLVASGGGSSNIGLFAPLIGTAIPTTTITGFTTAWAQSGTYSTTNAATGILMADTASAAGLHPEGVVKTYPATPFTAVGLFSVPLSGFSGNSIGFAVLNTLTTQAMRFGTRESNPWDVRVDALNTPTSFSANVVILGVSTFPYMWMKYKDNGTTITYSVSTDGSYYQQVYSVSRASSFLGSSGFNYFGIYIDPEASAHGATLMSYTETSP